MTDMATKMVSEQSGRFLSAVEEEKLIEELAAVVAQRLTDEEVRHDSLDGARRSEQVIDQLRATYILEELRTVNSEQMKVGKELSDVQASRIRDSVDARLNGLGVIQSLLEDDDTTDVIINGYDHVFIKKVDGSKKKLEGRKIGSSDDDLVRLINAEAQKQGKTWNVSEPALGLALKSKVSGRVDRLSAVAFVSTRPTVTIRRPNFNIVCLQDLVELNTVSQPLANLLRALVLAKKNILVSGGTGAGKTVLLRCLMNEIKPEERLVTIEDPVELGLQYFIELHPDQLEGFSRRANAAGKGEYTIRTFLKEAGLRQTPDRVLVGEIRGAEAVEMYSAMTQGNSGSMCTIHADSAESALQRLQMYLLMAPEQYSSQAVTQMGSQAVDFVVHVEHLAEGRMVTEIRQVTKETSQNFIKSDLIFSYKQRFSKLPAAVGMNPVTLEDLKKGEEASKDTQLRIAASSLRSRQARS